MDIYKVAVCLIGDSYTGKTKFNNNLVNKFSSIYDPTIGVNFDTVLFSLSQFQVKWQIWDTAGDPKYTSIIYSYFRNNSIYLLFFDLNNKKTFDNLNKWTKIIKDIAQKKYKIFLIGNKSDLKINVKESEIHEFCELNGIDTYIQVSLKKEDDSYKITEQINKYIENLIKKKYRIRLMDYSIKLADYSYSKLNKKNKSEDQGKCLKLCSIL